MRHVILAAGLIAVAALGQVPGALGQTSMKLGYAYPNMETAPLYVAEEKGFLREERLSVELIALASGDKLSFALLSGSIDMVNYTPDWFVRAIEKGETDLKIVLSSGNVPVYSLVVTKDIHSYADLKDKRIAVSTVKAADAYFTRKMMAAHGLADADYILIQAGATPERAAALKAGSVSASLIAPPIDQRVIDDEGGLARLDVTSSAITHYAWQTQTVKESWAVKNRATLVGYIRAWMKATRWLYDPANKEEAIRILMRELKLEDRYARTAYEMYFGPTLTIAKDGEIDLIGIQELLNGLVEQGDMRAPTPPPQKYVNLSYWEEARKSLP
ncbi:MAG TPA: ABC transporter substrate-binding protein [Alphaproteobacteria bacterium]